MQKKFLTFLQGWHTLWSSFFNYKQTKQGRKYKICFCHILLPKNSRNSKKAKCCSKNSRAEIDESMQVSMRWSITKIKGLARGGTRRNIGLNRRYNGVNWLEILNTQPRVSKLLR